MAKLALIFLAVFFIQLVACAHIREKRDVEVTTASSFFDLAAIGDKIKSGIETTFSEQNIKKAVEGLNDFGEKAKDLGTKVYSNFENALKKEDQPST